MHEKLTHRFAVDARRLFHFVAVVEHGGFRRAAGQLGIAQPALTRSIHELEEVLNARLLNRGPNGTGLTPAGEALFKHARIIDSEWRYAIDEIADIQGNGSSVVKVGVGAISATQLLPPAIAALKGRRPELSVSIVEGVYETLIPAVQNGEVDFLVGPADVRGETEGLSQRHLFDQPLDFVSRSGHPLMRRDTVRFAELMNEMWIFPIGKQMNRLQRLFELHELARPVPFIESSSPILVKRMLMETPAVTVMARSLYQLEAQQGLIQKLPVCDADLSLPITLVRRAVGRLSPACEDLINEIKKLI